MTNKYKLNRSFGLWVGINNNANTKTPSVIYKYIKNSNKYMSKFNLDNKNTLIT